MRFLVAAFVLSLPFDASALAPINARHLIIAQSDPMPNNCKLACAVCKCPVNIPPRTSKPAK
jgi:hypothetical protein